MTDQRDHPPLFAGWRRELALGFGYWLAFVLVLEPGNIVRAIQDGGSLPLGQEALRIVGAAALGAAVTPPVFALSRRFAIEGAQRWRNLAIHVACDAGLAVALIGAAGILASLILSEERRPLLVALREQFAVDGLLLFFCIAALTALAHAIHFFRRIQDAQSLPAAAPSTAGDFLTAVPIKTRGALSMLDIGDIDWIETQGNYLALHAGAAVHLIRETSVKFEARLDPKRFARIHRRTIVALDRIARMSPLANGDATLRLRDGNDLRVSRNFREDVRTKFEAEHLPSPA